MEDELVVVECEDGKVRYDVPGAPYAEGDVPAPVRLLGTYDNVWLSHANRDHIVPVEMRLALGGRQRGSRQHRLRRRLHGRPVVVARAAASSSRCSAS